MSKLPLIVLALCACFSSHVPAQGGPYLEFQVVHEGYEYQLDRRERITYTAIFDTSVEEPLDFYQNWIHLHTTIERAVYANSLNFEQANTALPYSPTVENTLSFSYVPFNRDDLETRLTFDRSSGSLTMEVSVGDQVQDVIPQHKYRFRISDVQGFGETLTLPTDLEAYMPEDLSRSVQVLALFQLYGPDSFHINIVPFEWPTPGITPFYYSNATLSIKVIKDPDIVQECIADINRDGFIDFYDISAFLDYYGDGCQ